MNNWLTEPQLFYGIHSVRFDSQAQVKWRHTQQATHQAEKCKHKHLIFERIAELNAHTMCKRMSKPNEYINTIYEEYKLRHAQIDRFEIGSKFYWNKINKRKIKSYLFGRQIRLLFT